MTLLSVNHIQKTYRRRTCAEVVRREHSRRTVSIQSSSPPSVSDGIQLTHSTRRSQASHPGCMSLLR